MVINYIVYLIFVNLYILYVIWFFCNIEGINFLSFCFDKIIWCCYCSVIIELYCRCYLFFCSDLEIIKFCVIVLFNN